MKEKNYIQLFNIYKNGILLKNLKRLNKSCYK